MPSYSPHPQSGKIYREVKRMATELERPYARTVFRCVHPKYARPEYLVDGEGTRQHGGRWMRPGFARVVHASSTEMTAVKEARQLFSYYNIIRPLPQPRVLVALAVSLRSVLDLSLLGNTKTWLELETLIEEDWKKGAASRKESLSQAVGRVIYEEDYEGLLAPSRCDSRSRNLAFFPDNLRAESRAVIAGEEELREWIYK